MKRICTIICCLLFASACTMSRSAEEARNTKSSFQESGTIGISQQIPTDQNIKIAKQEKKVMAPLIGYVPNAEEFFPAYNEHWLKVDKATKTLVLLRGEEELKRVVAEGEIKLKPGTYSLQHKEVDPLWYAPDTYFTTRNIDGPESDDLGRYRRGAYGEYALFLYKGLSIHNSPIWTDEVGGLRVEKEEVRELYRKLGVGSQIIIN